MYHARFFLAVSIAAVLWPAIAGADVTTYSYTGGEQTYTVPAGVRGLSITAIGAPGGGPLTCCLAAGRGAVVVGIVDVTPGQVVYVEVGGTGGFPAGGFNGGGDSPVRNGINAFGGGGASDVRTLPMSAGVISLSSRLIVAAGGGGSGFPAAAGGDAGAAGGSAPGSSVGGGAGTQTAGGAGGCDALNTGCGVDGSLGAGGAGGSSGDGAQTREGAGGGGGLYGGGGGGGVLDGAVGGGGGGSSLVPSDLGSVHLASLTTAPTVQIAPVPPPTCQNLTTTTPYGQAVIVQLRCTEFARRALSYAIVGAPPHGRLSAVTAAGQVTYTPAPDFSGNDSFGYNASSTNGTSSTTSVSIAVTPVSVARAGHARQSGTGAKIPVTCIAHGAGAVPRCKVTATMSVTEILRAHKLVAVTAAGSNGPRTTTKVITVGQASVVVKAGHSKVVNMPLDAAGRRLLTTRGRLTVSLVVTQTTGATKGLVSRQRFALRAASTQHK